VSAARLAEVFGTSPLRLLDCDENDWLILIACAKVLSDDRAREKS
jgi:hypothetical protein